MHGSSLETLKGRGNSEGLEDGRIILKWILSERVGHDGLH
jgi:hypothetical protein